MAEWDDVRRIALALPETGERPAYGNTAWRVRDKIFVWERPLRPKEASDLGERAPSGPILAVRVEDLGVKEALLQDDPETFFTTSHFDGYAAVLIRLDRISAEELSELIVEAWLCRAQNDSPRSTSRTRRGDMTAADLLFGALSGATHAALDAAARATVAGRGPAGARGWRPRAR